MGVISNITCIYIYIYIYIPHEPQLLDLCSPTSLGKPPCRTFIKFITSHWLLRGASKCPLFLRQETRSRSDHCHSSRLQALPEPPEPPELPPGAIRISSGKKIHQDRFGWANCFMKIIENPWPVGFRPSISRNVTSCKAPTGKLRLASGAEFNLALVHSDISDMVWKVNQ